MLNSTASPLAGPPHFVDLHVNPGESVSIQLFDGNETILRGPATITMISQHAYPPMPIPVQVPPGHMIQQIVDENGQLRHIILSAVPNNGTANPSNTVLMPQQQQTQQQQQQQQQTFPYCCCCCYSCTGTTPTAPLPPAPPPPPQLHHNLLAFPTPPNRRRLNPINRTFSGAGKRSAPTFLNNNSIGKSPVRNKLGSPAVPVDGVPKIFANRHTNDGKPYELSSNRVLVGKMSTNDNNCLSDSKHVINKNFISREAIDRGVNSKHLMANNGPLLSTPRPAPPFSFTSLDEHKNSDLSHDTNNCSHYDTTDKPPFLLEINLSSADPRAKNNLSSKIVEEVEEEEEPRLEQKEELSDENSLQMRLEVPDISLMNNTKDNMTNGTKESETLSQSEERPQESLSIESNKDVTEVNDDINQCSINTPIASQMTSSCISPQMQDNQIEDSIERESQPKSSEDDHQESVNDLSHSDQQLIESPERPQSIDLIDNQSDKPGNNVCEEIDNSIAMSSEDNKINNSINRNLAEDEIESQCPKDQSSVLMGGQRSPKHLLPQLQLLNLTYTSLTANTVKLKWAHSQPHSACEPLYTRHYVVEMVSNKLACDAVVDETNQSANGSEANSQLNSQVNGNSRVVYQGHSNNCRISHLLSQQQYSFRVRTTSEEHLVVSNVLTITTPEQQPINAKFNKKSKRELLHQQIQQQQHQIHQQQLLLQQQQQLQQQTHTRPESEEPSISSDQRCAILLLLLFSLFALIVAVLIQQLLSDN